MTLQALERDQGSGLEALPWATPYEASHTLEAAARERLRAFRRRVGDAWLERDPASALCEAFSVLHPGQIVALYPGAPPGGPAWIRHNLGPAVMTTPFPHSEKMPQFRLYELKGRDRFANRPVAIVPLLRANLASPNDPFAFLDALLGPNHIPQQLRMVLFDQSEVGLYAGVYRSESDVRFTEADHALLSSARPTMRAWMRLARAIGRPPLGDAELVTALNAFSEPALLVERHRVVHANDAGRSLVEDVRRWLERGRPAGFAAVTRLAPRGVELELVLPSGRVMRPSPLEGLPPFLKPVAQGLARGASDKEIALATAMPLATVRTYVTRIFARLGIRSRRELMALVRT